MNPGGSAAKATAAAADDEDEEDEEDEEDKLGPVREPGTVELNDAEPLEATDAGGPRVNGVAAGAENAGAGGTAVGV
jgi:hypothetical protein